MCDLQLIKKFLCPVIIFAENPIEIKKKAKISFLLEILLKMKKIKKYLCPVIIFAEIPIEIKKKAKISFLLEILLKMKNEKMKKKYDSLLE